MNNRVNFIQMSRIKMGNRTSKNNVTEYAVRPLTKQEIFENSVEWYNQNFDLFNEYSIDFLEGVLYQNQHEGITEKQKNYFVSTVEKTKHITQLKSESKKTKYETRI